MGGMKEFEPWRHYYMCTNNIMEIGTGYLGYWSEKPLESSTRVSDWL